MMTQASFWTDREIPGNPKMSRGYPGVELIGEKR